MKFALSSLHQFLDGDFTLDDVTAALNRIGHEVEGVENPAERLAGFRVARVISAERHAEADRLQVLSVDTGDGAPLQVVCGAPNARAGLVGVLGLPGAIVPANGMELKTSAIRGVTSNGMMCSSRELELGDDHDGIIELPADAPVGMAFADYSDANDPIIDVAITPNRQDCMGVMGIARDLAAAGLGHFKPVSAPDILGTFACPIAIRTDDVAGCPAFYGRVIRGVRNGPSPAWLQKWLKAAGQRPISALVDCTNYLMLAYGRPAHAYDLGKLSGAVRARRATDGEIAQALNGKSYMLDASMTVIADDAGVHDIAGIMGGEDSGCSDATRDVLLEIAYFTPENIALTGQKLGLASDARSRFERGVDPAFLDNGLALLTDLILNCCGGEASEIVRAGSPPIATRHIAYDPARCAALGGMTVTLERQRAILHSLGFGVGDDWQVAIPSWRRDIDGPADLVEEVTRIIGFDAIASVPLPRAPGVAKPTATPAQITERRVRRAAAALGFAEAVTWSFISTAEAARVGGGAHSLANPMSEDLRVMRPSLLPGLLSAAARNMHRGAASIRLFELGRRYLTDGEHPTLTLLMTGDADARSWDGGKARAFGPFDAKAAAQSLLHAVGAPVDKLLLMGVDGEGIWHPGQSLSLRLGPKAILAEAGALHPALTRAFDLSGPVMAVNIYLDALPAKRASGPARDAFAPPTLQSVTRDFAFIVPHDFVAGDLVRAVRGADKANIVAARIFDRFAKDGQTSLAVEVSLQPIDKSYDEAALKAISDKVVAAAAKIGAVLRG
ncbi:MAG: phenylalanine--tRNA ligase subunit beta [Sphingomonadaceae bacterium]|nr:phenylalanine--tRNA ligase subunit beta [Sphingomonadaceae bacterium]